MEFWMGKPLDDEVSRRILEASVAASGLPAQVASPGSRLDNNLVAYIIGSDGEASEGSLDSGLEEAAAQQLARELIAAVIRFLQAHGSTEGQDRGEISVGVPLTGQPPTGNDMTVRGYKIVGDRDALGIALHGPVSVNTSTQTDAKRDTGEVFRAFQEDGVVYRLTAGLQIEVLDAARITVLPAD